MLKNYNKYKVLKVFFNDPLPENIGFQLREISRKIKLAPKSVSIYLKELEKEGFILKKKLHVYPVYYANIENQKFKHYKKRDIINELNESGLIKYIWEKIMPDAIILFGSASKGEDTKKSDIDLCVISKQKNLNLSKYEKIINRKINILYTDNFNKLSNELKNNIINGIVLSGYLKVF